MKTILHLLRNNFILIISIFTITINAQQGINYQGLVKDSEGNALIDTEITLDVDINKTTENGETVYAETHNSTTDSNGIFSIVLGNGTPSLNLFEDINWAEDKHFLKVSLDGEELGVTELLATPYSKAMGKWQAHKNGVTPRGTGGSVYIGEDSGLNDNFDSNHNIGIGESTLKNSESFQNIAIGKEALMSNTTGWNNLALGPIALKNNTEGNYNIALGVSSLFDNTSGNYNTSIGGAALRSNTEGDRNIAVGYSSLNENLSGHDNIALGYQAIKSNTSGQYNIALGRETLLSNTLGHKNIAIGEFSLYTNRDGDENIALGSNSLNKNVIGNYNIGIGSNSLEDNTSGNENVAIGKSAMNDNIGGSENTAIGSAALLYNQSGDFNTAVGSVALRSIKVGDYNTAVGAGAGYLAEGNSNVFLGLNAGFEVQGDHKLYIENTSSDSPLIYGEFDNNIVGFNANVGIKTHNPLVSLHVAEGDDVTLAFGTGYIILGDELQGNLALDSNEIQARDGGLATDLELQALGGDVLVGGAIVQTSDKRLKRDIATISYGLQDVLKLRPTEYFWKGKEQEHKSLGLIAQEVDEVIENVVNYNEKKDKYGVNYTELIPVLIKALQEQQEIINSQDKTIENFEKRITALEENLSN